MSEQRLIDAIAFEEKMKKTSRYFSVVHDIREMTTIDPETLPIVQELRAKLERYEQAEEEGRLLTLPCKIGDNIYVIPSKVNYNLNKLSHPENNKVYKQMVSGIRMYHGNDYLLETCEGFCTVLASYFESTWFLTEEEAEAALKDKEKQP